MKLFSSFSRRRDFVVRRRQHHHDQMISPSLSSCASSGHRRRRLILRTGRHDTRTASSSWSRELYKAYSTWAARLVLQGRAVMLTSPVHTAFRRAVNHARSSWYAPFRSAQTPSHRARRRRGRHDPAYYPRHRASDVIVARGGMRAALQPAIPRAIAEGHRDASDLRPGRFSCVSSFYWLESRTSGQPRALR